MINKHYHKQLDKALAGDPAAAGEVIGAIRDATGLAGTLFGRGDAQSIFDTMLQAIDKKPRPLTDDEWDAIQGDWAWRKGLEEILTDHGWEIVRQAVETALPAEVCSDLLPEQEEA